MANASSCRTYSIDGNVILPKQADDSCPCIKNEDPR